MSVPVRYMGATAAQSAARCVAAAVATAGPSAASASAANVAIAGSAPIATAAIEVGQHNSATIGGAASAARSASAAAQLLAQQQAAAGPSSGGGGNVVLAAAAATAAAGSSSAVASAAAAAEAGGEVAGGSAAARHTAATEQWWPQGGSGMPDAAAAAAGTSASAAASASASAPTPMDETDDSNQQQQEQQQQAPDMDMRNPHEYNPNNQQQEEEEDVNVVDCDDEHDAVDRVEQLMLRKAIEAAATAAEQRAPVPTEQLFAQLHEALALESKYQPSLFLSRDSNSGEVTCGTRDGAAQVLRCLKMWYELPSDVLFTAINLVDRFLTKMTVKPKHIACISVGSFLLAVQQLGLPKMETEDLVTISQCRCTSGDLERMAGIIANKLGVQMNSTPVTALACLRLIYYIIRNAAHEMGCGQFCDDTLQLPQLEMQLEILACDAECSNIRATELALVLICTQLDAGIAKSVEGQRGHYSCLVEYAIELQNMCRVSEGALFESFGTVVQILTRYNAQQKMPYRQRLVWKLSSRTMRALRPTDKLTSHLPTIAEHNVANNNSAAGSFASRFRTGSVSSEEGEDWPSSPVVPVYETC